MHVDVDDNSSAYSLCYAIILILTIPMRSYSGSNVQKYMSLFGFILYFPCLYLFYLVLI